MKERNNETSSKGAAPQPWDALLARAEKPSRYLGREINAVHKDPAAVVLRAVLVFPDLYEVGMAHLGTRILYGLGNELEGIQVERVFLPGMDFLSLLREEAMPLATLESRTPLKECHLLGITLQSELTFSNILTIMDAAGIPFRARDRSEGDPVVIGGGPCAFNPEPLAEFFDLFHLGDGEVQWPAILKRLRDGVDTGEGRAQRVQALKEEIPGIYCPEDFEPRYAEDGSLAEIAAKEPGRDFGPSAVPSLDTPLPSSSYIVPYLPPVHDRINIEATRGCTRGCRFCHAGMVYRPVREKAASSVLAAAEDALDLTGYEDLALTSLSIGDYGPLDEVLEAVMDRHGGDRVSVSLPSMRIGGLTPAVAQQVRRVRRTGFTIAPEAGTPRLRRVLNKDFSDEEILRTARWVFEHGWEAVKLYFMIGLPTETENDLDAIVRLVRAVTAGISGKGRVTVNLSPFVPKAHTPFQWAAQDTEAQLKGKLNRLKRDLKGGRVQVRWSRTDQALLEAVLARGDRRVGRVIEQAWLNGAAMDGWEEHFDWRKWELAFDACALDPHWYSSRERDPDEILPWDHIPCGVNRDFLLSEYRKSLSGEITPDCREGGCHLCGACTPTQRKAVPPLRATSESPEADLPSGRETAEAGRPVRRVRLVFSKTGDLRFLGHLETVRMFERAFRRAGVPLAFTGGFSPKPRITFALSLPTGTEALAEWMDVELAEAWPPEKVMERTEDQLPHGIEILDSWQVPVDVAALNSRVRFMDYKALLPEPIEDLDQRVAKIMASPEIPVVRLKKGKERTINLKDYLVRLESDDERTLAFSLALKGEQGSARPQEVIQAATGLEEGSLAEVRLTRTGLTFALEQDKAGGRPGWTRIWD